MKSLYQFILEREKAEINLYNLSYDLEVYKDEDKLHDETFVPFLYEKKIISTDIEFQFINENNKPIERHTHYVIKPVATTIIFGSDKEFNNIVEELLKHDELNFALQELKMNNNKIEGFVINNHFCDVDEFIKRDVEKKRAQQHADLERFIPELFKPKKIKVKLIR